MARSLPRIPIAKALVATAIVALALLPGCLFCGGQTGECGTKSEDGDAACTPVLRGYTELSGFGFAGADVVAALGGSYAGTVTLPPELATTSGPVPVTLTLAYTTGSVTDDCSGALSIPVTVTLDVGPGQVTRSGSGTLVGSPSQGTLTVVLPPPGGTVTESVSLSLTLGADGTAAGPLTLGTYAAQSLTATRQ